MLDAVPNGVAALSLDELIAHYFDDEASTLRHHVAVAQNAGGYSRQQRPGGLLIEQSVYVGACEGGRGE